MLTWSLMLVFPRRPFFVTMLAGRATPLLLTSVYVALIGAAWRSSAGGFTSLSEVKILFGNDWLLLAGWIHYLVFDLLVGRWQLLDSQRRGLPHLLMVPCLLLTFLFGPGGWLLYVLLGAGWTRRSVATAS